MNISVVIPARNEAEALAGILERIGKLDLVDEIIVVDDGSNDDTAGVARQFGASVLQRPYGGGNGAAIKWGARTATGDVLVFMDADGQHDPDDIPALVDTLARGFDMVVGARSNSSHAGLGRLIANKSYNRIASYMVGHPIDDLTSGFRAVRADKFREFLFLLPNGFSYPTTITMAFFRAGYRVAYKQVNMPPRTGKSHIRVAHDGARFLLIIFRIGTMYSPLKLFIPIAAACMLSGFGWYLYTYFTAARFTNMSALLITLSVLVFLMGLISEQITMLMYKDSGRKDSR